MNLSSPTTMIAAWVLLPILVAVISGGLGLLLERAADARLGLLAFPFGFAVAIVVEILLVDLHLPSDLASVIVALLALAGILLRQLRPREAERTLTQIVRAPGENNWSGAAAGVLTYVLCMIPLIATGKITLLGYYFLNDPSFHIATAEWIHAHGVSDPKVINSSISGAANLINSGYPTGVYSWPVIGISFLGTSALAIWTPICALTLAMLAVLAQRIVRRSGADALWSVPLAIAVAAAYLPFSYLMQGGLKELIFAVSFTLAGYALTTIAPSGTALRSLVRATLPAAFAVASMIVVFGPGAGVWIGQLTVFAFFIAMIAAPRVEIPRLRVFLTAAIWGVLIVLLTLPAVLSALHQLSTVQAIASDTAGIGNLLGFVPSRSMLPGWVSDDYRLPDPTAGFATISRVVVAAAGILLVIGGIREFFTRRFFVPVTGITAAIALAYLTQKYNAYFVAKGMVVFVPVIGCAVASGLIWLIQSRGSYRVLGIGIAGAFALTFGAAFVQTYAHAWTTPTARLEELAKIDHRAAGDGPTLLNEREDYGQSTLIRSEGIVPYAMLTATGSGTPMLDNGGASFVVPQDLDGYETAWLERRKVIVSRRGPGGSRPPSNYTYWFSTDHYTVWRQHGPPPKLHIPLGLQVESGLGKLDCADPKTRAALRAAQTTGAEVILATRADPAKIFLVQDVEQFPRWAGPDADGFWSRDPEARASFAAKLTPGQTYTLYTQGQFGSGIRASVNGKQLGGVTRDLGSREHWTPLGTFKAADRTQVAITPYGASSLAPGGRRPDAIRAFAFSGPEPSAELARTDAAGARAYCGRQLDWIEIAG